MASFRSCECNMTTCSAQVRVFPFMLALLARKANCSAALQRLKINLHGSLCGLLAYIQTRQPSYILPHPATSFLMFFSLIVFSQSVLRRAVCIRSRRERTSTALRRSSHRISAIASLPTVASDIPAAPKQM